MFSIKNLHGIKPPKLPPKSQSIHHLPDPIADQSGNHFKESLMSYMVKLRQLRTIARL